MTLGKQVNNVGVELRETLIGFVTEKSMNDVVAKWETQYGNMAP